MDPNSQSQEASGPSPDRAQVVSFDELVACFNGIVEEVDHTINYQFSDLSAAEQNDRTGRAEIAVRTWVAIIANVVRPHHDLKTKRLAFSSIWKIFMNLITSNSYMAGQIRSVAYNWGQHLIHVCDMFTTEEIQQIAGIDVSPGQDTADSLGDHHLTAFFNLYRATMSRLPYERCFRMTEAMMSILARVPGLEAGGAENWWCEFVGQP
ncbi:hypothetical protein V8F20_001338 [Naviculisporaceae sp. PSN 640]